MRYTTIRRRKFLTGALQLVGTLALATGCQSLGDVRSALPTTQAQSVLEAATSITRVPSTPGQASPAATAETDRKKPNYFRAVGSSIVDAEDKPVLITGINWFGMETATFAPHGLWVRNWQEMLDLIVELGFNTIRLPFSNAILDPNSRPLEGIDFNRNPELRGLNGLEIMDTIILGAGERKLKVILDRHRPTPNAQSKLWYTDEVGEDQWISDWESLARRYLGNDTVIGADIHNEPAGDATWGTSDGRTDWRLAAERCGNAILSINPDWLIIVEGIEKYEDDWYWMGGNLRGAATAPVRLSRPDKLVYSAHDYGPGVHEQRWFKDADFPNNMAKIWDDHWGFLVRENIAPVLLGEFGGRSVSPSETEGIWHRALIAYLEEHGIPYTYWCLNPNSGDTGGILKDDWHTVDQAKHDLLSQYLAPLGTVHFPDVVHKPTPVAPRKTPLPEVPVVVTFKAEQSADRTSELTPQFRIVNRSVSQLPLEYVELRYWFTAEGITAPKVQVDWASVGDLQTKVVAADQGDQTHTLVVTFGPNAGFVPANSAAEIKLRIRGDDKTTFDQSNDFSFQAGDHGENERVALYFWGERIWGREP